MELYLCLSTCLARFALLRTYSGRGTREREPRQGRKREEGPMGKQQQVESQKEGKQREPRRAACRSKK
jgi:hypothetical protein